MSVILKNKIWVEPMKCHRCSHEWNYSGKNIYVATCPHCRTTLTIRKHKKLKADGSLPASDQPKVAKNPYGSGPGYE